jgi:C-8 sterol isomerase
MLPFGLADTFSSTLDFYTLAQTFKVYGKCVVNELLQGKF